MTPGRDDLGLPVALPREVCRVVSLVPSLTEAVAVTVPGLLVGATDWCTHPSALSVSRVGGTKSPATHAVLGLRPDLVVANEEENRAVALDALAAYDLVVLPDEPYAFATDDGPEAFAGTPVALVSGRHLTWCGPSLVEARALLLSQLDV